MTSIYIPALRVRVRVMVMGVIHLMVYTMEHHYNVDTTSKCDE